MRVWAVIIGSILFLVGVLAVGAGGTMSEIGAACARTQCSDGDVLFFGAVGNGIVWAGALVGLGGISLMVAGLAFDAPRGRTIPIRTAEQPCASCGGRLPEGAHYCPACGITAAASRM